VIVESHIRSPTDKLTFERRFSLVLSRCFTQEISKKLPILCAQSAIHERIIVRLRVSVRPKVLYPKLLDGFRLNLVLDLYTTCCRVDLILVSQSIKTPSPDEGSSCSSETKHDRRTALRAKLFVSKRRNCPGFESR
jgi:hypothetical protein